MLKSVFLDLNALGAMVNDQNHEDQNDPDMVVVERSGGSAGLFAAAALAAATLALLHYFGIMRLF